jgi:hypothetical protein
MISLAGRSAAKILFCLIWKPKRINHESTKFGKHENYISFEFSSFRDFVIEKFFNSMKRIQK